ncbi:hypothetical protein [Cellulophaga lytica]|uniref:hypothetical protein n=1 Tax=Cellulophaga lytica TaxID=979 RepID=UPI003CE531E6
MASLFRRFGKIFQWNKLSIWEIKKHSLESLYIDENGEANKRWIVKLYYNFIPFVLSVSLLSLGVFISDEVSNYLITGVSIFAGLFFNLLLIIADKLKIRRELLDSNKTEAKENYLKRFEIFSRQFISTISYAVIQAIWLIILMTLCKIEVFQESVMHNNFLCYLVLSLTYLFNFLTYLIVFKLIVLLFTILSSLYIMIFDDLNLNNGKHKF